MLANICKAIDDHAGRCDFPPTAVVLNPKAKDELDWDEVRGLPVTTDERLERWRFRIACDREPARSYTMNDLLADSLQGA